MKKFRIILVVVFSLVSLALSAQQANTLYYMDRVFHSQTVNVSEIPANKVQVGGLLIPVFGQVPPPLYINYGNSSFRYNDIIHFGTGRMQDSLIFDFPLLMSKAKKLSSIRSEFRVDLLDLGFRLKNGKSALTISLAERVLAGTNVPYDMFELCINGNLDYMNAGKSHIMSKFSTDVTAFHELAVGYTSKIGTRFQLGGRLKLMFGISDVSTDVRTLEVRTDPDEYFITAIADLQVRKATAFAELTTEQTANGDSTYMTTDFSLDALKTNLMSLGNFGLGLDLGFTYNITKKLSVSISATDWGFINWTQNAQVGSAKNEYTFEGIEIPVSRDAEGRLRYGIDTLRYNIDHITDTLIDLFDIKVKNKSYMSFLPSNVFVGASYKLHDKIGFGILYRGQIYRKAYNQSLTLSANSNITHWLSLHLSWSLINNSAANVGFGFSVRAGFVTWYAVTDNVIGLLLPQKARTLNLRMGCNLTFGHPKKVLRSASRL